MQCDYLLTGWCVNDAYTDALTQFQSLEKAFQITGTATLFGEDDDETVDGEPETEEKPMSKPARGAVRTRR